MVSTGKGITPTLYEHLQLGACRVRKIKLMLELLCISGSLRQRSSNTAVLEAVRLLAPSSVKVTAYAGLADLPPFNPDRESEPILAVQTFRDLLERSSAVLISSPEYAHGLPGVLKNALDWVVGSGELSEKPVVLLSASPRAVHAQAQLEEVLFTMNARVLREAFVSVNLLGSGLDAAGIVAHPEHSRVLREMLEGLLAVL